MKLLSNEEGIIERQGDVLETFLLAANVQEMYTIPIFLGINLNHGFQKISIFSQKPEHFT